MKLGEVIKHRKGFITIDDNKEYKLCRVQVHRKGVVLRSVVKGSEIKTKKQQVCKAGDFLVAEMDAKFGGYGFIPKELDGAIVSSHYFLFELDEKKIRPKYLEVVSKLLILQDQIKATGSTNYSAIRPTQVLSWDIPYRNIVNQKEIENLFENTSDTGSSLKTELKYQEDLVKQLRQAFLQDALQGRLTKQDEKEVSATELLKNIKAEKKSFVAEKKLKKDKGFLPIKEEEIPFRIPENWVWCRLGEIVNIKSGKRIHAADYRQNGIPFLRSGEIGTLGRGENLTSQLYISQSKYNDIKSKFGIPKEGDILIACIGGSIGNTWVVDDREFYYKDGNLVLIESIPELLTNYLLNYLKSSFFWNDTIMNATDSSYNALTIVKLNEAKIPLPPLAEQKRIVKKLEEVMNLCDELKTTITDNQNYTNQLLQVALKDALQMKEVEV